MQQDTDPKITVLMPVYNGDKYLRESIDSILNQTFTNFEFIIIDDGSTDKSPEIIDFYAKKDSRIKFLSNLRNFGLIYTLNRGIQEAKTNYIARMDQDDVSLPYRFEKQVQFLNQNPKISVLGTSIILFDENLNIIRKLILPSESFLIKWSLCFFSPLAHPTVMFRRSMLLEVGTYNMKFKHVEDYELWLRSSAKYDFHNLDEALLHYRLHTSNISVFFKKEQDKAFLSLASDYVSRLIDKHVESDVIAMLSFRSDIYNSEKSYLVIQDIYRHFIKKNAMHDQGKETIIRMDMYDKMLGIIKRDKNNKRRIAILLKMLKIDFFLILSLLLAKIIKLILK